MILEALADYLEDQNLGTVNTDILIGELPYDKSNCIALMASPSPDSNYSHDLYEQVIDINGRFTDSGPGYQKMLDIFNLLHKAHHYTIGGYYIYFSNVRGAVNDNGRDVERRKLFNISIRFIYRLSS